MHFFTHIKSEAHEQAIGHIKWRRLHFDQNHQKLHENFKNVFFWQSSHANFCGGGLAKVLDGDG